MAATWTARTNFAFTLAHKPGALADFTEKVGRAGINLLGLWGYASGDEPPVFSCVPEDAGAFREFMSTLNMPADEGPCLHLEDDDRRGALVPWLREISEAGINLDAIETVASSGRFGAFIWCAERDWPALKALLT